MSRPTSIPPLAAIALALALASTAAADPVMRFTWGPADAVVLQQNFAGPATYTQTLSVTGLSGSVSHLSTRIAHGPYDSHDAADVWRPLYPVHLPPVQPPIPDCLGDPFYVVSNAAAGATTIPNATLTATVVSFQGITNFKTYSQVELELFIDPPLVADPGTRYAFATIEYRHQNSAAGETPGTCHHADRGFCFVQDHGAATVNGIFMPVPLETGILAWQGSPDATTCLNAITPARGSTWGAVKILYR